MPRSKTVRETVPRFIADAMLGRLAKWLRLLGFDAAYDPAIADEELVSRSLREGRVVLTRDRGVSRRRSLRTILIESGRVGDQLAQVLRETGLRLRRKAFFTRCSLCNAPLETIEKKTSVWNAVPRRVYARTKRFFKCRACRKVYWLGSHGALFRRALRRRPVSIGSSTGRSSVSTPPRLPLQRGGFRWRAG